MEMLTGAEIPALGRISTLPSMRGCTIFFFLKKKKRLATRTKLGSQMFIHRPAPANLNSDRTHGDLNGEREGGITRVADMPGYPTRK